MHAATVVASLVLAAPVTHVAHDGAWVAASTGRTARDCNRVTIWNTYPRPTARRRKVFPVGRRTSCAPGNRITAVSEIGDRAVWVHRSGGDTPEWTLWTATPDATRPRLLRRAHVPILLGRGNLDRRAGSGGEGDGVPYAIDSTAYVLGADAQQTFSYDAPARVTAIDGDVAKLALGLADGEALMFPPADFIGSFVRSPETYDGVGAVTAVAVGGPVVQRGRTLSIGRAGDDSCGNDTGTLPAGVDLVSGGGGLTAFLGHGRYRVQGACDVDLTSRPVATGRATAIALDNDTITVGVGRRVTVSIPR
jgi:hypothetical protein